MKKTPLSILIDVVLGLICIGSAMYAIISVSLSFK